jgi:2-alkenal reductase
MPLPELPDEFFRRGEGSGFVWDDKGHLVTNNHVLQGAEQVTVAFADRTEMQAKVIGRDPDSDLAVLELLEAKPDARPVVLGDSDTLKVGQMAVAIGNPFGQQFTMTTGIVSALGRTISSSNSLFSIPQVVQTDAPINPGNSGGPLIDRHGRVIGVNTQIISRSGVSSGVGFSVPVNTAKQVIPVLISDGKYRYSWLGITGTTLTPEIAEHMDLPEDTGGALVIRVTGDSPADLGGLRDSDQTVTVDGVELPFGGDVIVAVDGSPIRDMSELITYLVNNTRPEDKVLLEIIRDGEEGVTLEVTLGTRPES